MKLVRQIAMTLTLAGACSASLVWAHGDVVPQAVDTTGLDPIGKDWVETNPYRGNEKAIEIGKSAYGQNCARCHGLEAVSGGIAPDLRNLPNDDEGDEIFKMRVQNGAIRNGVTYMPAFEGVISQEALWTIRSWLQTVSVETAEAKAKEPAAATKTEAAATESAPAATPEAKPAESASTPAAEAKPADSATTPATTEAKPAEASSTAESKPAEAAAVTTEKPVEKAQ